MKASEKVKAAAEKDKEIYSDRGKIEETFGHNPEYLLVEHGITKSDLIRLERKGLALKARYVTRNPNPVRQAKGVDGPHRVRWLLFKEVA